MKLADFFVKIGFDADSTKVKDFAKAVGEIPLEAVGALAALAGLEFGIAKMAGEAMNAAVGFQAFTTQTGLSAQDLQKWQVVAAQANVSAEAMTSSVAGLQKQLAEIRLGRGNIAPFAMLGINPRDNAFGVLQQLRKRIPGMDRATATNLISQMGLSPEMMNVLALSQNKFEEFGRRVRVMSAADEESFLKSKLALTQLGMEFKTFGFEHLAPLAQGFSDLFNSLNGVKEVLPMIGGLAVALGLAFAPVTTAIVGLLAVLDDLMAYKQGRNSLIGFLMEKTDKKNLPGTLSSLTQAGGWLTSGLASENAKLLDKLTGGVTKPFFDANRNLLGAVMNVDIRVDGAGDPHHAAQVIEEHLKRTIGRTGTQTSGKQDRR